MDGRNAWIPHREPHRPNDFAGPADQKYRGKADGSRSKQLFQTRMRDRIKKNFPPDRTKKIPERDDRGGRGQIPRVGLTKAVDDFGPVQIPREKPNEERGEQKKKDELNVLSQIDNFRRLR